MLLLIITATSLLVVLFMPKRISLWEMYTTSLFASMMAILSDLYLDVKFDLYGFFHKGVDWQYIPILVIIYPVAASLIVNFYPYQKNVLQQFFYIFICSAITTLSEYITLQTHLYYYNGWKLWYSALLYPFLYIILILHIKALRKMNK